MAELPTDAAAIVSRVLAENGATAPEVDTDTLAGKVIGALSNAEGQPGTADQAAQSPDQPGTATDGTPNA